MHLTTSYAVVVFWGCCCLDLGYKHIDLCLSYCVITSLVLHG